MWPKLLGAVAAPRIVAGLYSIAALCSLLGERLDLDEDSFSWPHPMCSGEARRGHEEVKATLAEMCDAIAVVARLGMEVWCRMADKVVVRAQVNLLAFLPCRVCSAPATII